MVIAGQSTDLALSLNLKGLHAKLLSGGFLAESAMYDFDWHKKHEAKTEHSAVRVLSIMREIFELDSILDIGCGDGIWLDVGMKLGFMNIFGVDGPWTDTKLLKIPPDIFQVENLENNFNLSRKYDIAISLEVAEHLSPGCSDHIIDNLTSHSDLIVFGAAIPYQGGFRHINEHWQSFWAGKFAQRGYTCFDVIRPQVWDDDDVWFWYKQNILVYIGSSRNDLISKMNAYIKDNEVPTYPLDLVHPEKYVGIASYDHIAFKPLLKKLPSRILSKSKSMMLGKT